MKTLITAVKQCAELAETLNACELSPILHTGGMIDLRHYCLKLDWPTLVTALEVLRDIHQFGKPYIKDGINPIVCRSGKLVRMETSGSPECVRAFERLNNLMKEN